jgi:hypothetical protein
VIEYRMIIIPPYEIQAEAEPDHAPPIIRTAHRSPFTLPITSPATRPATSPPGKRRHLAQGLSLWDRAIVALETLWRGAQTAS